MRRFLTALTVIACLATPAFADRPVCNVTTVESGLYSQIGAVLEPSFDRLLVQTQIAFADIELNPESGFRAVEGSMSDFATLYVYYFGDAVPGKDWRQPGGVSFKFGGFGIQWPSFVKPDGVVQTHLRSIMRKGEAVSDRIGEFKHAGYAPTIGQVMTMDERMWSEWPYDWDHRIFFKDEWPAWHEAIFKGSDDLTVAFHTTTSDIPFAAATFKWPSTVDIANRVARDIGAFRKETANGQCETIGPRKSVP